MFKVFIITALVGSTIGNPSLYDSPKKEQPEWYSPKQEVNPTLFPSTEQCVTSIYKECNYPTVFTDEELENVRQFLNYSFTVLADIKPDKPLCPKLHVRQDWKCLTQQQKTRVTNVWKQMYKTKIFQKLTDVHVKFWPEWHKTHEFLPGHRWLENEFEKEMRTIDPDISLPYWDAYTYGSQPERSSIWDTLGHSGNYSNGYSVSDGIYAEWGLIPTIKRHWESDGTILPWYTQEFVTWYIQNSADFESLSTKTIGIHFAPHLNIGGYEGQFSIRWAPYEVLFYLYHTAVTDIHILKWQLFKPQFLTPLSYDDLRLNPMTGAEDSQDIRTDTITGAPQVTVRETFWVGFGDYCFIPDQLVRPINSLWKGIRDPIPTAAKRLPQWIIEKHFPFFHNGNFSAIFHNFEEVGECNTVCHPIPRPTFMRDTEQGRRQFQAYRYDEGIDSTPDIERVEHALLQLWTDLNRSGYCSPYVTTY